MKTLRVQLDRIDHEILKLLQQRTKLSRRIGEAKRRHGAVIYVPERERELLHRVIALGGHGLPSRSVAAIYREILSGSRAAQGQGAIGLLQSSSRNLLLPARWCFGACAEFATMKSWPELEAGLGKALALVLLTGADLGRILGAPAARRKFLERFVVVSDLAPRIDQDCLIEERIFIIAPRMGTLDSRTNRVLILIECKSREDAVKNWLNSMRENSIQADTGMFTHRGAALMLVRLNADKSIAAEHSAKALAALGTPFSILGIYGGPEDYGG